MSLRKHNEFLDVDESDAEGSDGYQSDNLERGRGAIGGNAIKRRKVDSDRDEDSEDEEAIRQRAKTQGGPDVPEIGNQADGDSKDIQKAPQRDDRFDDFGTDQEDFDVAPGEVESGNAAGDAAKPGSPKPKPLSKSSALKAAERAEKAARKSGVIYISRVPPFMKPHTLKHYLEPQAPKGLGRIFLTPEDHANYLQRKKAGGNKKKSFTDGWVEFNSKSDAKMATSTLNGNIIGGRKGGYYHDDLWNMKYLKGFKWSHLTEQIAAENAEREARMRDEIRKTKKENKAFLDDFERGKMLENMDTKRKAKAESGNVPAVDDEKSVKRPRRQFEQSKVQPKSKRSKDAERPDAQRALSMIF